MLKIITFPDKCTGCKCCELACSFHHKKFFGREFSSISISQSNVTLPISMRIFTEPWRSHVPCDFCAEEDNPFCEKYCSVKAVKVVEGLKDG